MRKMKYLLTLSFLFVFCFSYAQDLSAEIKDLEQMVSNEDYMSALGLADKLIGNRVKEGQQQQAAKVYFFRGIAKHRLEMEVDAVVDLKVALSLDNSNTKAYYYIADIYYNLLNYPLALENVIYFLEKEPNNIEGLSLKSKAELENGNVNSAKMTIQKALALKSSEPELYYIRAVINAKLDDYKLACKDIKIAAKFGFEKAKERTDEYCKK